MSNALGCDLQLDSVNFHEAKFFVVWTSDYTNSVCCTHRQHQVDRTIRQMRPESLSTSKFRLLVNRIILDQELPVDLEGRLKLELNNWFSSKGQTSTRV